MIRIKHLFSVTLILFAPSFLYSKTNGNRVKVGYFHGGRTKILFRALINNTFEKEGIDVELVTKDLHTIQWKEYKNTSKAHSFTTDISGKVTGAELIKLLKENSVDVAAIGEAAFIKACSEDLPILAIAQLGSDEADRSGHGIGIKSGIKIENPDDLKKITWGTRFSSGGDDVFLKEFLLQQSLSPDKVKIISGLSNEKMGQLFDQNKIQGAYFHLLHLRNEEQRGRVYLYRKLDWINPQISHAVLVVKKSYYNQNKDKLKKLLRAYIKQNKNEVELPKSMRSENKFDKDLNIYKLHLNEMEVNYKEMNLPQYSRIPLIDEKIETDAMELFFKHKYINKKIDVKNCFDNTLVEEAGKEIYGKINDSK